MILDLERRENVRINSEIPAVLTGCASSDSSLNLPAVIKNISLGGACVTLADCISIPTYAYIKFNLSNRSISFILKAKIIAQHGKEKNIKFEELRLSEFDSISKFIENRQDNTADRRKNQRRNNASPFLYSDKRVIKDRRLGIKYFPLFIDGENYDTGKYEYFPYQSKFWQEPKKIMHLVRSLKQGIFFEDYEKYIYARYSVGNSEANLKAIESAYKASRVFRNFSLRARYKILEDIHSLLLKNKQHLIDLMVIEGHPLTLAGWEYEGMESAYRKESLDFFKTLMRQSIQSSKSKRIFFSRRPDGVVCVVPPKNAPCSNSLLGAFALLSGNSVIVKPPLKTPLSTTFLWREVVQKALEKNGAPKGTVNIINGNSKQILEEWLDSPLVNDVLFFGDSEKGLEIGKQAYLKGKKAILELSGNDIMFVWKDADLDKAVESFLDCFLGSTQICMVPKKAVVHESLFAKFVEKVKQNIKNIVPGLPEDAKTVLSPVGKKKEFFEFLQDALDKDAEILTGGYSIDISNQRDDNGLFLAPTVVLVKEVQAALNLKCIKEENFFPLIPIVRATGSDKEIFAAMQQIYEQNEYGLRVSVWVKNETYERKFARELSGSGLLRINSRHVGFSAGLSSHGGMKKSGGPYGEMNYVWQKTSHLQGIARGD